ncbi:MAG: ABC transporter ATP-binding protein/permease [Acidocella sp.]|nr:ABC transporter ATP-binding protein/permease [Acidocella sp.]
MRRSISSFLTGLREGWVLTKPYFASEDKWSALGLLAAIILLNLLLTELNVDYTYWLKYQYDSLQTKNFHEFLMLVFAYKIVPVFPYVIIGFVGYAAIFIVVAVYAVYLNQMLQIRWRQWMTRDFSRKWLADRAYYNISLSQSNTIGVDNPDQRISQDLADFTSNTLGLGLDLLSNIVTLVSFVTVLYFISGSITVLGFKIPGYMLWLAIIYSIIGTWLTHKIGNKLINLNFMQQKVEADFRYSLIRVRDNPEAIALSGGEEDEFSTLRERFAHVRANWWAIMRRTKMLGFFTNGYSVVSGVFPLAAAAPRYFAGLIQLGDLIQISSVFGNVQGPLSWIVGAYGSLVSLRATVARLYGFQEAVTAARAASRSGPECATGGTALNFENLTLTLPDGRKLIENTSLSLPPGEPIILTGASGAGKSTLFRALAGIWPFGAGEITLPPGRLLFLPQKPYFPLGTLKRNLAYPAPEETISNEAAAEILTAMGLGHLIPRLEETANWGLALSGGEQQRLALGRAILAKPDWLFLDEATSALDTNLAKEIRATLRARLPQTTIVAISHHETSSRQLRLTDGTLAPGF